MNSYFLLFLGLVFTGLAFFGLPILTSLIFSSVSAGYMASLLIGLIPARCIRRSTVRCGMFNLSAISVSVNPFISFIIGYFIIFHKMFEYTDTLLNECKVKIENIFKKVCYLFKHILTKCLNYATLYNIRRLRAALNT